MTRTDNTAVLVFYYYPQTKQNNNRYNNYIINYDNSFIFKTVL